ncbi:alpha/beta hydrolase [Ruania alba]|uniref:Alpha/beta hydrolase n=1 Tax=Ruania alba TaxID=648782 RepID=A0A1H5CUG8_9MICO|nr:alpha/beta hydrolase [Ruania alba]SED70140.1 Alpha/beta hydrolase [Ruania alba]
MSLTSPNRGFPLEKIDGSAGDMRWWSSAIGRLADRQDDVRSAAEQTMELPGTGKSVTRARDDAADLLLALATDIAAAELLVRVLADYAEAYDTSASSANDVIGDVEDAHAAWQAADVEYQEAALAALWSARGDDEEASATAHSRLQEADEAREGCRSALDELWETYEQHYAAWDEAYDEALTALAEGTGTALTSEARDALAGLLACDTPAEVAAYWEQLGPGARAELSGRRPEIIGNLDGIPYDVRHAANVAELERAIAAAGEPVPPDLAALEAEVEGNDAWLVSFDPDGSEQVTAALAYGDLAGATDLNVLVPGMDASVTGMPSWGASARALNEGVEAADAAAESATVVWFGYDTPSKLEEPFLDRAEDGAASLSTFLDGLQTVHPDAENAVIAHSYGSTTAALAIGSEPGGHGVDQFIAVGSAGFPNDEALLANLNDGPDLYASLSPDDPWARIGRHVTLWGGDRVGPEGLPGATEFDSDGGYARDPDGTLATDKDGEYLHPTEGHSAQGADGYLSDGSESLYNIEQIVAHGEPGTVTDGVGSEGGFWESVDDVVETGKNVIEDGVELVKDSFRWPPVSTPAVPW